MGEPQDVGDAERVLEAVRPAVADLGPSPLRDRIFEHLADSSMDAGRLVYHAVATADGHVPSGVLNDRVVGVQLIYEGLALIRALARDPPWDNEERAVGDLDLLVAEVLVAKGFSLLASTDAAPRAVETVRTLGRSETERLNGTCSRTPLEADIFELGVVAGVTATEEFPLDDLHDVADRVAGRLHDTDDQVAISFAERWQAVSTSNEECTR